MWNISIFLCYLRIGNAMRLTQDKCVLERGMINVQVNISISGCNTAGEQLCN